MKPRIYKRYLLNIFFGRAAIAEVVSKQNSYILLVMKEWQAWTFLYCLFDLSYAFDAH